MRNNVVPVFLVLLGLATVAQAQTKMSGAGRCGKLDVQHAIEVPDRPNHTFAISQGKCTWSKPWEIAGVQNKEGVGTVFEETTGNTSRSRELYVDTMANGDKAFYRYEATTTLKDGKPQSSQGRWTLVDGTGKLKGIKGKGTCKATKFEADGSFDYECEGEYTPPAQKP